MSPARGYRATDAKRGAYMKGNVCTPPAEEARHGPGNPEVRTALGIWCVQMAFGALQALLVRDSLGSAVDRGRSDPDRGNLRGGLAEGAGCRLALESLVGGTAKS